MKSFLVFAFVPSLIMLLQPMANILFLVRDVGVKKGSMGICWSYSMVYVLFLLQSLVSSVYITRCLHFLLMKSFVIQFPYDVPVSLLPPYFLLSLSTITLLCSSKFKGILPFPLKEFISYFNIGLSL